MLKKTTYKNTNFVVIFHGLLVCEGMEKETVLEDLEIKTAFDDLQITPIEAHIREGNINCITIPAAN